MNTKMKEDILKYVNNNIEKILFAFLTIMSLIIRLALIKNTSGDLNTHILSWFYNLKNNGGIFALKYSIGDYNAPYVTILSLLTYLPLNPIVSVKSISILFDYICALAVMELINIILKDSKNKNIYAIIAYGVVLLLPTVVLNSSYWGQADSIYTAFIIISLVYLIKEKYILSFVFLGISFAFKLQFIFILPLYILVYISNKKISILHFLILPVVNFILCVPSILLGKPLISCLNVYINQATEYNEYLCMNFPNIWNILMDKHINYYNCVAQQGTNLSIYGILITITLYAIIAFLVLYKKVKFDKQKIIEFGLLSIMIATFFLPYMHDRYLYMADIISIIYYFFNKDKIYVPVSISIISLYTYAVYLFEYTAIKVQYVTYFYLIILILVARDIYNKYLKIED